MVATRCNIWIGLTVKSYYIIVSLIIILLYHRVQLLPLRAEIGLLPKACVMPQATSRSTSPEDAMPGFLLSLQLYGS